MRFMENRLLGAAAIAVGLAFAPCNEALAASPPLVDAATDAINDVIDDLNAERDDLNDILQTPGLTTEEYAAAQEEWQRLGGRAAQAESVIPLLPGLPDEIVIGILEFLGIDVSGA